MIAYSYLKVDELQRFRQSIGLNNRFLDCSIRVFHRWYNPPPSNGISKMSSCPLKYISDRGLTTHYDINSYNYHTSENNNHCQYKFFSSSDTYASNCLCGDEVRKSLLIVNTILSNCISFTHSTSCCCRTSLACSDSCSK